MMVSIKDVAKRAGVSIATVSNVINCKKNVSEERTKRVQIAIKELGYHTDPFARSMKTGQSNTIGLISTDIGGMFYSYVIESLCDILEQNRYHLTVIGTTRNQFLPQGNASSDPLDIIIEKFQSLVRHRVDGIIFTSTFAEQMEEPMIERIFEVVSPSKIPLVTMGSDLSDHGIDSIYSDSFMGGKVATNHLIKQGCRKIAHVAGPTMRRAARQRLQGYQAAIEEARIPSSPSLIASGDFSHHSGFSAMNKILSQNMDIDGVYVANDQMAVGAMRAIRQHHLRVPEDIRMIGYDDVAISSVLTPPLSTMHVQKRQMGISAAETMLKRLSGEYTAREPIVVKLDTQLIIRQSSCPNMPDDWIISDW